MADPFGVSKETEGLTKFLTRQSLEKFQVFIYVGAILSGLIVGSASPGTGKALESALWPILGLLLYATFTQVPLSHFRDALVDFRFLAAAFVGNFVVLPVVVWGSDDADP